LLISLRGIQNAKSCQISILSFLKGGGFRFCRKKIGCEIPLRQLHLHSDTKDFVDDHDDHWEVVLVSCGILVVNVSQLSIFSGQSAATSDFMVNCLIQWWQQQRPHYPDIQALAIGLDGGSAVSSHRTQFIKRMVQSAQATGRRMPLIYYPPDHSKYNPIERCWAALENDWKARCSPPLIKP
jgi:hypothetical protein